MGLEVTVKQLAFIVENEFTAVDKGEAVNFHNIEFHYLVEPLGEVPFHMIENNQSFPCHWIEIDNLVNINIVPAFLKKHLLTWSGTIEQIRIKEKNK